MSEARDRVVTYLKEIGWVLEPANAGEMADRWSRPGTDYLIPIPHQLEEGDLDWDMVLNRLATLQGITSAEVRERITVPDVGSQEPVVVTSTAPGPAPLQVISPNWPPVIAEPAPAPLEEPHQPDPVIEPVPEPKLEPSIPTPQPVPAEPRAEAPKGLLEFLQQNIVAALKDQGGMSQVGTSRVLMPHSVVDVDALLSYVLGSAG